jgi:hypothetical protein
MKSSRNVQQQKRQNLPSRTQTVKATAVPADFLDPMGSQLNHLYMIVHAVEGLDSGAYVFHRDHGLIECLKQGNFQDQAGYLGSEQALPARRRRGHLFPGGPTAASLLRNFIHPSTSSNSTFSIVE